MSEVNREHIEQYVESRPWTPEGRDGDGPTHLTDDLSEFLDWVEAQDSQSNDRRQRMKRKRGFLCRVGFHNWKEIRVGLTGTEYECKNCDAVGFSHMVDEGDIFKRIEQLDRRQRMKLYEKCPDCDAVLDFPSNIYPAGYCSECDKCWSSVCQRQLTGDSE